MSRQIAKSIWTTESGRKIEIDTSRLYQQFRVNDLGMHPATEPANVQHIMLNQKIAHNFSEWLNPADAPECWGGVIVCCVRLKSHHFYVMIESFCKKSKKRVCSFSEWILFTATRGQHHIDRGSCRSSTMLHCHTLHCKKCCFSFSLKAGIFNFSLKVFH